MSIVAEPQTPRHRHIDNGHIPVTPRAHAMGNRVVCATPHRGKALNNYSLGDRLGRGAFATVYKAIHLRTAEIVAIKQIPLEKIKSVDSIMGEIELLQELQHPNIVKYLGFMKDDMDLNIVLEYCENGSLAMILHKFGSFPENLVARYIRQVLDGLVYLHRQGTIHRDIKGANILTTKEGIAKLADFGVATRIAERPEQGGERPGVVGTPHWMAPEIIQMQEPSTACDIWSLGATIVELRTGQPPYGNRSDIAAMYAIVQQDSPAIIPADSSGKLRDFLTLCFEKDPVLRVTASDLRSHPWILKYGGDSEAVAHPEAAVREWNSPSRRKKLAVPSKLNLKVALKQGNSTENYEDAFHSLGVFGQEIKGDMSFHADPLDLDKDPFMPKKGVDVVKQTAFSSRKPLAEFQDVSGESYEDDYESGSLRPVRLSSNRENLDDPFVGVEDLLEDGPDESVLCAQEEARRISEMIASKTCDLSVAFTRLCELIISKPQVRKVLEEVRTLPKALDILTSAPHAAGTVLSFLELVEAFIPDEGGNDLVTSFCIAGGLSFVISQSQIARSEVLRLLFKITSRKRAADDGEMSIARQLAFREDAISVICQAFDPSSDYNDLLRASSVILEIFRTCGPRNRANLWHHFNAHGLIYRLMDLLHISFVLVDDEKNPLAVNFYLLIVSFSRTPQELLITHVNQKVLRRLMRAYIKLPVGSPHRIVILEFFRATSTLVPILEALQRGNVAPHLIAALRRAMHDERVPAKEARVVANSLVPTLFNYARIERYRQREVAKFGLPELLQDCIAKYPSLREFVFPTFNALIYADHPECWKALWDAGTLDTFIDLITEPGWQAMAIAAIASWLVAQPSLVRPKFVPQIGRITEALRSSVSSAFESTLSAISSLLDRNRFLCGVVPLADLFESLKPHLLSMNIRSSASLVQALQVVAWVLTESTASAKRELANTGLLDTIRQLRLLHDIPAPCIKLIGQILAIVEPPPT